MAGTNTAQAVVNNFGSSNDLAFRIVAASNATTGKVWVVPGIGVVANKSLPTNVSYSGPFATFADQLDYLEKKPVTISSIRLQTDNTLNFAGRLEITERKPNNQNNKVTIIELADYRQSNGGDYADNLIIPGSVFGRELVLDSNVSIALVDHIANSFVKYTLGVVASDGFIRVPLN